MVISLLDDSTELLLDCLTELLDRSSIGVEDDEDFALLLLDPITSFQDDEETTLDEDFGVEDDEEFAELEEVTTLEDDAGVALLLDPSLELEENSSFLLLELDGFAELLDATTLDDEEATELLDATLDEDFGAEDDEEATELLDATLDEDFAELLLDATELEEATTLEDEVGFAELLDVAELDEATFDDEETSEAATTLILPVTVFVSP